MRKIYLVWTMLLFGSSLFAQSSRVIVTSSEVRTNSEKPDFDSQTSEAIQKYKDFNFEDQFVVLVEIDQQNNFFLIDISEFKSQFEKNYFLKLVKDDNSLKLLDDGQNSSKAWLCTDRHSPEEEIMKLLVELKTKTFFETATYDRKTAEEWLNKNTN